MNNHCLLQGLMLLELSFPEHSVSIDASIDLLVIAQALNHSKLLIDLKTGSDLSLKTPEGLLTSPAAICCYLLQIDPLEFLKLDSSSSDKLFQQLNKGKSIHEFSKPASLFCQYRLAAICFLFKNSIVYKQSTASLFSWYETRASDVERAQRMIPTSLYLLKSRNLLEEIEFEYDWSIKRIPKEGERNILITSALPYVNNVPHLGNIIGAVLSADVYARYCRARGYNVVYICGTDEYGTATETKALEESTTCEAICSKFNKVHEAIYDWFQIKFDIFGRTSTKIHETITHEIFQKLYSRGYFLEESLEQTFCEKCDRFLADRYVEGTCPLCGFNDARGDQCDGCGKLVNAVDLKESRCKICKSRPIVRSSQHLFLDLTRLQDEVEKFVEESSVKGGWSGNASAIAKAWIHEGLKARCMTRDLKWGTKVPLESMKNKVFYVWFDAPIGYLSITACYTDEWRLWWENPSQVQLYQFMGKDNVPFHTIIFPATLIGTGHSYSLLHNICTTEYLNYESGKFSKSRGTGVFGTDARDCGIPPSLWRYYLLSTRPEVSDSVFSWEEFGLKINSELIANFGNFINRITKFTHMKLAGRLSKAILTEADARFVEKINQELAEYHIAMEAVKIRAALKTVMNISALGNGYLTENHLDNKLLINEAERCGTVLAMSLNLAYLLAPLIEPFLPSVCTDLLEILNAPARKQPTVFSIVLGEGHELNTPFALFDPLDPKVLAEHRARYSGKQTR